MEQITKHFSMDDKKINKIYNDKAKNHLDFNAVLDASQNPHAKRVNLLHDYIHKKTLLKWLKPTNQDIILDFGTGMGRLSSFISPKVQEIWGVDASQKMLHLAINNQKKNNDTTRYVLSRNLPLPLPNNHFNKAFSYWVLASISDELLEEIFPEINRVLKMGGTFVFFEQIKDVAQFDGELHKKRTLEEYQQLGEKHGFELIAKKPTQRMPSYAIHYWKKFNFLPKYFLYCFYWLEQKTINRKKENVEYFTYAFQFKKLIYVHEE